MLNGIKTDGMTPEQQQKALRTQLNIVSKLADPEWFEMLKRSITEPSDLPAWPSNYTQEVFVGFSGEAALSEAFRFFQKVRDTSPRFGPTAKVLDFGVGWGRIIRCFYRDIPINNLYGVDVDPVILEESRKTNVRGNLQLIDSAGKLPYADRSMDISYAYSVFSHLSESAALHWIDELMRVLKADGTLVLTSTTSKFLDLCRACREKQEGRNIYEDRYAAMFEDPHAAIDAYKSGKHVYAKAKGNADILDESQYGWAAIPPEWLKAALGKRAKLVSFTDDGSFEQGIFVVKRERLMGIF